MENATSEPVKLKASTEILDRAGIRGGQEFDLTAKVVDERPAAQIIAERLERLAGVALERATTLVDNDTQEITDAEIVEVEEEEQSESK